MAECLVPRSDWPGIFDLCIERIGRCKNQADLDAIAGEIRELKEWTAIPDGEWGVVKRCWLGRKSEVTK